MSDVLPGEREGGGQGPRLLVFARRGLVAGSALRSPVSVSVVPIGLDPAASEWALLGQDPLVAWTGPAPLVFAAAGRVIAEDETGYCLDAFDDSGAPVQLGLGTSRDLVEVLEELLDDEAVSIVATEWGLGLSVAESCSAPPQQAPRSTRVGRVDEPLALPAGPPALLQRVVSAGARACLQRGRPRGATRLLPRAPSGPSRFLPLREAWLGLSHAPRAFGSRPWCRALETLVGASSEPTRGLRESLERVTAQPSGLCLVESDEPVDPLELRGVSRWAIAAPPGHSIDLWTSEPLVREGVGGGPETADLIGLRAFLMAQG